MAKMSSVFVSAENTVPISERMSKTKDARVYRRLQAVLFLSQGKTLSEAAELTGYTTRRVRDLVKALNRDGVENFGSDGRKGGNNRLLTREKAEEFLRGFETDAENGHILTTKEMSAKFDAHVGKTHKSGSTFYALIHRMNWRLVIPRRKHPKKPSDEAIEASKKLTAL